MTTLAALRESIGALERELLDATDQVEARVAQVAPRYRASARNFAHYVSVRQHDLRALQLGLLGHGLSSLGRLEGHVVDAIAQVRQRLDDALAAPRHGAGEDLADHAPSWDQAQRLLHAHTQALLGPRPAGRHVYVMVTAPSSDEVDDGWCGRLLDAGMNLLRINAAHEDEAAWTRIVTTARATAAARQVPLRIAVDLPGPKLRTVMLTAGPRVVKWKPAKDALGRVVAPRMIALHSAAVGAATADGLAVPTSIWATLAAGDQLTVRDARGKRRVVRVLERGDANGRGEVDATTYVTPGAQVCVTRVDRVYAEFTIVDVPARRARLEVAVGQTFAVVAEGTPVPDGMPGIGCTLPAALAGLTLGQRVLFDDGHLETEVAVAIAAWPGAGPGHPCAGRAIPAGRREGHQPARQRAALAAVLGRRRAGAGVRGAPRRSDRRLVRPRARGRPRAAPPPGGARRRSVGLVLKIETAGAFARLPAILLAALERAPVGVMIARGDLAIESGYQRLAELQEEILWLCEAAHVPVIWATEVLDSSRAPAGRRAPRSPTPRWRCAPSA
jgi:pyruvate kinase